MNTKLFLACFSIIMAFPTLTPLQATDPNATLMDETLIEEKNNIIDDSDRSDCEVPADPDNLVKESNDSIEEDTQVKSDGN